MYYKLIDAIAEPKTFYADYTTSGGMIGHKHIRLNPGVKYAEYVDDPVFLNWAKELAHDRIAYTEEREEALKACGARYEVVRCKVCGGMAKKLDVWFVEVVDDEHP